MSTTQIIKLAPGESIILPKDAVIESVTQFDGGVVESDCVVPLSTTTETHYFFIEENIETGSGGTQFYLETLIIGGYTGDFNNMPALLLDLDTYTPFHNIIKAMPPVMELRVVDGGASSPRFSITVPQGTPTPYLTFHLDIDSTYNDWELRIYPLKSSDPQYTDVVSDLSDPLTIK